MAILSHRNYGASTTQTKAIPTDSLETWAVLNEASFDGVKCADAGEHRGSGLIATRDLNGGEEPPLLVVPRDLVLSLEAVKLAAKSDRDLRELLDVLGEFVQTARGAILTFLLYTATVNVAREKNYKLGSLTPFSQYISFLPDELLPTFWTSDEISLLRGTSIHAALEAKQKSLAREFAHVAAATEDVRWCQDLWWSSDEGVGLSLEDWKTVDAMYRSRALEFPGIGDAMVPCVDMANHAAGADTKALYETDGKGNAVLLLRDGLRVAKGDEVTITYGDGKGACEMLFSYGFIDDGREDGKELFLPLEMPDDDPLAAPKHHVSTAAPGVKFYRDEVDGELKWHSEYIYLMSVNQEDGLEFAWAQLTTGEQELQMLWHDAAVPSTADFFTYLKEDNNYDLFHLRAVALLIQRVEEQLEIMSRVETDVPRGDGTDIRPRCHYLAEKLRQLEERLLKEAVGALEKERDDLVEGSEVVKQYLIGHLPQTDDIGVEESEDFT